MTLLRKVAIGFGLLATGATICLLTYSYFSGRPVLYQTQSVDTAPLIFIQNPFRDPSRELAAENLLARMQGKTVTQSLNEIRDVRFNNPQGYVEQGELISWEISNRADSDTESIFYYFMYRGNAGAPNLSFATVTVQRTALGWSATHYRGLGTSNNS